MQTYLSGLAFNWHDFSALDVDPALVYSTRTQARSRELVKPLNRLTGYVLQSPKTKRTDLAKKEKKI